MADITVAVEEHTLNGNSTSEETVPQEQEEEGPLLSISINNVVCTFSTKCHLNLKKIALEGTNVEYHRQHGVIVMKGTPVIKSYIVYCLKQLAVREDFMFTMLSLVFEI